MPSTDSESHLKRDPKQAASHWSSQKKGLTSRKPRVGFTSPQNRRKRPCQNSSLHLSRPLLRGRAKTDTLISYWGERFLFVLKTWRGPSIKNAGVEVSALAEVRSRSLSGFWPFINHLLWLYDLQTFKLNLIQFSLMFGLLFCPAPHTFSNWRHQRTQSVSPIRTPKGFCTFLESS